MPLDVFRACISGYSDHIFDLQILGVQQGYWAGYYTRAKKSKPPQRVIEKMMQTKTRHNEKPASNVTKPEVDVEAFKAVEARFNQRMKNNNNR